MYTTLQVASSFHITRETTRKWCLEFREYLSPGANPGSGRDRLFTEEDMRVLALVSDLKRLGRTFEDVHVALKAGERGELPDVQLVPSSNERNKLLALEEDMRRLQSALHEALNDNQRKTGQIELLEKQLDAAEKKADRLLGEIAVLRDRLDKA